MLNGISENTENYTVGYTSPLKKKIGDVADKSVLPASAQNSEELQPKGDAVIISDEAQKLAEESNANSAENKNPPSVSVHRDREQESGGDQIKQIRAQIKEIKEKLQDAQERLAQAQAQDGTTVEKQGEASENTATATMQTLSGSTEVEAIQTEIKMLSQQLLLLNNQLQEAVDKNGGVQIPAMGTAGLGGIGESGGIGEHISVTV